MNLFTVDVEDWFHICGAGGALDRPYWDSLPSRVVPTTRRLLQLLDGAQIPATFFVVGWVAERYPELVAEIVTAGHEVGSHSHLHRRVYELTPPEFSADVEAASAALMRAGASRPRAFRAPEWSINDRAPWALAELARRGFSIDASMAPLKIVGRVDYPRMPHLRPTDGGHMVEVPPFVTDKFGQVMPLGWGWGLRMSSPKRVLASIEAANAVGVPAVLTVHPWEVDPDPPRVPLPPRLRFAHYFRLGGFERRLNEIVRRMAFGTLGGIEAELRTNNEEPRTPRRTNAT
jgi:polysaccharide deacetylase family protein (PEP-CTERM system associated)